MDRNFHGRPSRTDLVAPLPLATTQRASVSGAAIVPGRRPAWVCRDATIPAGLDFRNSTSSYRAAELGHARTRALREQCVARRDRPGGILPVLSYAMGKPGVGFPNLFRAATVYGNPGDDWAPSLSQEWSTPLDRDLDCGFRGGGIFPCQRADNLAAPVAGCCLARPQTFGCSYLCSSSNCDQCNVLS